MIDKEGWEIADWLNSNGIAAFVLKYRLARAPGSKIGFSAGGEIVGMIETRFDAGKPDAADPVEGVSSRPDFTVSVYPSYRPGARNPDAAPLFPVPNDAPPAFLVCTTEDRSHVEPTVKFYLELESHHIPAEMHIYEAGPHGYALRPTSPKPLPVMNWPERLKDWLALPEHFQLNFVPFPVRKCLIPVSKGIGPIIYA